MMTILKVLLGCIIMIIAMFFGIIIYLIGGNWDKYVYFLRDLDDSITKYVN